MREGRKKGGRKGEIEEEIRNKREWRDRRKEKTKKERKQKYKKIRSK
jgi:hypothetical protein